MRITNIKFLFNKSLVLLKRKSMNFYNRIAGKLCSKKALHLELTSKCNLNCTACYRSGLYKKFMNLNKTLEYDKLVLLLKRFKSKHINTIILSGGENLLHPDFFKCLALIERQYRGKNIILSTNGIVLTKDKNVLNSLCKTNITHIQFSLHGATQKTIDKLQRGINLSKTIEVIKYLMCHSNIIISVNYVIQDDNYNEITDFIKLMGKHNIKNISLTPINYAGHTDDEINYYENWAEIRLKELLLDAKLLAENYNIIIPDFQPVCTSAFDVYVLTVDGDMLPCWGKYLVKKYSIGNVFTKSPKRIRHNKILRNIQKGLRNNNPPDFCKSCWANGKFRI